MTNPIRNHWRADISAAPGSPSEPVALPRRIGTITVKALPGAGGTAEIQYTLDPPDEVTENPGAASWEVWDPGAVAADTTRCLLSVVGALRLVAYSQPAAAQVIVSYDF
jgi:hypothetical protein